MHTVPIRLPPTPCSSGLKHGTPGNVALVRSNNRPVSLSGVRAHAGPATEAGTQQQDLPQRKPGRVVSIPVPKAHSGTVLCGGFSVPSAVDRQPWRVFCALCPFSVSASAGPPCLCAPLNCNGFCPHSVSTGAFACFPNQTLFPLLGEQGDPSLPHLSLHKTESSPKTNPIWLQQAWPVNLPTAQTFGNSANAVLNFCAFLCETLICPTPMTFSCSTFLGYRK